MNCVLFLFLFLVEAVLGIIDLDDPSTKPPIHRENLPWPTRPRDRQAYTGPPENQVAQAPHSSPTPLPFTFPETQNSPQYNSKFPQAISPSKQVSCPYKATGQFPYAPDCRRFINCFKGRGVVQVCAPGTLFNPLTQECDFPAKVRCLEVSGNYRIQPGQQMIQDNVVQDLQRRDLSPSPNEDWKNGFKSYKVTSRPQTTGYGGVQPPYVFTGPQPKPMPSSMLQPSPPLLNPMPSPVLQPPSQFNIPPMMFSGSPNISQNPTLGSYNPYQIPQFSQPQNQPGYPISQPNPNATVYARNRPLSYPTQTQYPHNKQVNQYPSNYQPQQPDHSIYNPFGQHPHQQNHPQGDGLYSGSPYQPSQNHPQYPQQTSGNVPPLYPQNRNQQQNPYSFSGVPNGHAYNQNYPTSKPQTSYSPVPGNEYSSGRGHPPNQYPVQNSPGFNTGSGYQPGNFPSRYPGFNVQGNHGLPNPHSRQPDIFPQGGQPGYFLLNHHPQTTNGPIVRKHPPKYVPADQTGTKCPAGASGLFPHPDCHKFLNCDNGRTFVMSCGSGTVFNPAISACDWPSNVDCGRTDREPSFPDVGDEFSTYKPITPTEVTALPDFDSEPNPSELVEYIDIRSNIRTDSKTTTERPRTKSTTTTTKKPLPVTVKPTLKPTQKAITFPPFPSAPVNIEQKILPVSNKPPLRTPKKNIASRHEPPPISKQLTRLRGGQSASEGYLEMRGLKEWGIVCDRPNEWTIQEANIVCKQLGYQRGAELTWQGRPTVGDVSTKPAIAFSSVWCNGNETNILDCTTQNDRLCKPEREAVWIHCHSNPQSLCQPGETSYNGKCYLLVVPKEEDAKIDSIGFSQGEALAHCQVRRGHLLDITSQPESDFVSEWLVSLNTTSNIMTAGVGVSIMGASLWIWEGSPDSFKYSNWWPGWENNQTTFPGTKSNRALCVIARRYFPCPTSSNNKSTAETAFCDAEYYFWDVEDCSIMSNKHPYVCERSVDDVGCVKDNGHQYLGNANVSESSKSCLSWNSTKVIAALKYRVSETSFRTTLAGHNYCRNIAGSEPHPWCYVEDGDSIKKEPCDIPVCIDHTTVIASERSGGESSYTCGSNLFTCELNECIPSAWVCDGQPDCKNGLDEQTCAGGMNQFQQRAHARLVDNDKEKWLHTSASNCATRCLEASDFVCRSFSHSAKDQICLLSDSNIGHSGKLVANQTEWDYYERISHTVDCSDMFVCGSGKCINQNSTCNGKNDCGDRSDERNCSVTNLGYEIRLGGSTNSTHEGRIEIKILGEWGYVCDDQFDMRDAEVVCRELGFSMGAAEIRPHSAFLPLNTTKPLFLVDDLQCRGNETTIRDCDFGGWGVHDCGSEEVVGVVCKVPGLTCASKFWQCERSGECIPVGFLCDHIPDCEDGSDEDVGRCKQPVAVRLAGKGSSPTEGRLEVRKFGIWGTVCDDDFEESEAVVICRSLGYKGLAKSRKEAAYGAGKGIIWLDGVHCVGNESSVDQCFHEPWAQSDCSHQEDVGIVCLNDKEKKNIDVDALNSIPENNVLSSQCGKVDDEFKFEASQFTPKVVKGQDVARGTIPWQASLRVRTSIKSVHWCGAVILSPLHILTSAHCLMDYTKSAYFVRVGDFDTEVPEDGEQDTDIETIYIHEGFDKGHHLSNDVALIRLKGTGLRMTKFVQAVCLPTSYTPYTAGMNCTISGWGANGTPGSGYTRRLKATNVPIIDEAECRAPYVYGEALGSGMFCAGDLHGGADSCQGDSGGPFVCSVADQAVLYGITSWGHGCGRPNKPGVYTQVAKYIGWIHTKIHDSLSGK